MADPRKMGTGIFLRILMDQHGMSKRKATKVINIIFKAMVDALKEGKRVKIDGLGTLRVIHRNRPARRIGVTTTRGRSIYNYKEITVELRNIKLKLEEF